MKRKRRVKRTFASMVLRPKIHRIKKNLIKIII